MYETGTQLSTLLATEFPGCLVVRIPIFHCCGPVVREMRSQIWHGMAKTPKHLSAKPKQDCVGADWKREMQAVRRMGWNGSQYSGQKETRELTKDDNTHSGIKELRSLVVQWLTLRAPNAAGPGSIPGQGTRSHMLLIRVCMSQLKRFCMLWLRPGAVK